MKGGDTVTSKGAIQVHVFASDAQIPIKDAAVTITDVNGDAVAMRLTNRSGQLDIPVQLTVPDQDLSLTPDPESRPFALFDLYVRKEKYELINIKGLQVFADTLTLQPLELIPLSEFPDSWNQSETFTTTTQNL